MENRMDVDQVRFNQIMPVIALTLLQHLFLSNFLSKKDGCGNCTKDLKCIDCSMSKEKSNNQLSDDSDNIDECSMCNEKKNLVFCTGCHGELYCRKCFMENHENFELRVHKALPKSNLKHLEDFN